MFWTNCTTVVVQFDLFFLRGAMRSALSQSKFLDIAEAIMEKIIKGVLAPGDRAPSVRETAMRMGVTPNTAANAHAKLRDLGIIDSMHGSSSIVQPDAPDLCRSFINKKFIEHELPVVQRRMCLLGLSEEKVMKLLKGMDSPDSEQGEKNESFIL